MRDIKFRVWQSNYGIPASMLYLGFESNLQDLISHDGWEVMQDIGKKDIKGNLIFDQDIVRIKYPNGGDFANTIGRVFWDEDECNFYHGNDKGRPPKRMWGYSEVIGNVFETPKLWERIKKTL
jgi:hypothetical protein